MPETLPSFRSPLDPLDVGTSSPIHCRFQIRHSHYLYLATPGGLHSKCRVSWAAHVPQPPAHTMMEQGQKKFASEIPASRSNNKGNKILTGEAKSRRPGGEEEDRWKSRRKLALRPWTVSFLLFFSFPFQVEAMMRRGIKARAPCRPAVRGRGRAFRARGGGDDGDSVRPGPDKGMHAGPPAGSYRRRHHALTATASFLLDRRLYRPGHIYSFSPSISLPFSRRSTSFIRARGRGQAATGRRASSSV